MTPALIFKIVIILLLLAILVSLGMGMFFLVNDKGQSRRVVTSLSFRVAMSISLFIMLFVGYWAGLIKPHGIYPAQTEKAPPAATPPPGSTSGQP